MRRSLDGGVTWEPARVVVDHSAFGRTIHNFVLIPDRRRKRVCALFCADYARAYCMFSRDDGVTFTLPEEITSVFDSFRDEYAFKVIAIGPGHGIQLHSERLLAPIWISPGTGAGGHRPNRCGTIYSDDGGETWRAGELVPDNLPNCNEAEAVELHDQRVMLNIRHSDLGRGIPPVETCYRAVSVSPDGATDWSEPMMDEALPDPVCFASVCRHPDGAILFSNCASHEAELATWARDRKNLTVRLSRDEGMTWRASRVIEPGVAGYSDLAVLPSGESLCLYEDGMHDRMADTVRLTLARFSVDWLESGSQSIL
jgi:sialidase-1